MVMAELQPGMNVLETACGTGMVTFPASEAVGQTGSVFATDLSGKMITEVTRIAKERLVSNITFVRMGAEALDADDGAYDIALCSLGLMYVPDPRKAISEMRRVVKSGGRIVATIWGERLNCGWAEIFPIVDAKVASDVCPMFFASGAPGIFKSDFEAAGLTEVHEKRQSEVLKFRDAQTLTNAVILGGPVAMAVKRFTKDVFDEVNAAFLASVSEYQNDDGGFEIPGEFVTVSGTVGN
jgi:SAM-dependent methyltransferase